MTNPVGEIGRLYDEELPAIRVIVLPDLGGRLFQDDLDPGDVAFDGQLTPMLIWHERYPVGRGWRSGWVLSFATDSHGNRDDYIIGLSLGDVDAAVAQAREYLRATQYPPDGWRLSLPRPPRLIAAANSTGISPGFRRGPGRGRFAGTGCSPNWCSWRR